MILRLRLTVKSFATNIKRRHTTNQERTMIYMRFCDLFISYKIGLKGIKSTIPFTKLPLYRKVFVIILFASAIFSGILLMFKQTWASYIPIILGIISMLVFFIIDSLKKNLKVMLNEHYSPYSVSAL